jgi:hypothetical protein
VYIKEILSDIAYEDREQAQYQFQMAEQRLLQVYAKASDAFERSKKNNETITTSYTPRTCSACKGTGMLNGDPETGEWCNNCDGNGKVIIETVNRRVQGQAGDPNFLRIQCDCIKEINRIRGHYKENNTHLHIHQNNELNIDLTKVPDELLLQALNTIDTLKQQARQGQIETIDVESTPKQQDNKSTK